MKKHGHSSLLRKFFSRRAFCYARLLWMCKTQSCSILISSYSRSSSPPYAVLGLVADTHLQLWSASQKGDSLRVDRFLYYDRGTLWGRECFHLSLCRLAPHFRPLPFYLPFRRRVPFSPFILLILFPSRCLPLPSPLSVPEPNLPQSATTLPALSHRIFTTWGQPVLPTFLTVHPDFRVAEQNIHVLPNPAKYPHESRPTLFCPLLKYSQSFPSCLFFISSF